MLRRAIGFYTYFAADIAYHRNSIALMRCLGITSREISIRKACEQHFADIGLNPK